MTTGLAPRRRVAGVLAEVGMIVLAVLVALAVEEWREERQMLDFAGRARASVEAELGANLEELRQNRDRLLYVDSMLASAVAAQDMSLLDGGELDLTLPDLSTAAWEVAQGSQAAPYFDFEWVLSMARAYHVLDVYADASDNVIAAMSGIIGRPEPTLERIGDLHGWLAIINGVHTQAVERLEAVLADTEGG